MSTALDPGHEGDSSVQDDPQGMETQSVARADRAGALARRAAPWLVQVLALVPVLAMAGAVVSAPEMQWYDYWVIFPQGVNQDGSLVPGDLLSFYNGHVLAVPRVLFWLNYKLNSGLNSSLGLAVIAMGVGQVVVMRSLLPATTRRYRLSAALLVVGATVFIFAPQGTHNYVRAMSGSSWVTANLLMLVAVWVATRDRLSWSLPIAILLALLATVTYGTGLMTWAALLVVTLLRQGWVRAHILLVGCTVVALGAYTWFYERPPAHGAVGFDVSDIARRTAQVLGSVLAPDPDTASVVGVAAIVLGGFLSWRAVQLDRRASAPWVAILLYAVLGAAMIGAGRGGHSDVIGSAGRYTSISALCWCGLLVLAVWSLPGDIRVVMAALLVVGVAFVGGRAQLAHSDEWDPRVEEAAIATRLEVASRYPPNNEDDPNAYEKGTDLMRGIGHYPFSESFDADCGLLGQQLSAEQLREDETAGVTGEVGGFLQPYNGRSVRLDGWGLSQGDTVQCVLVLDESGVVIGAGFYGTAKGGIARERGLDSVNLGFRAVAPVGAATYRVALVVGDEDITLLPGELEGSEAPVPAAD